MLPQISLGKWAGHRSCLDINNHPAIRVATIDGRTLGHNKSTTPSQPKHNAANNTASVCRIIMAAFVQIICLAIFKLLKSVISGNRMLLLAS